MDTTHFWSNHNVINKKSGWIELCNQIIERAKEDKIFYDKKMPPPGNCGYSKYKQQYKNLLLYDPIDELEKSLIFYYVKCYCMAKGR